MTPSDEMTMAIAERICERTVIHRGSVGWSIVVSAIKEARREENEACARLAKDMGFDLVCRAIRARVK